MEICKVNTTICAEKWSQVSLTRKLKTDKSGGKRNLTFIRLRVLILTSE